MVDHGDFRHADHWAYQHLRLHSYDSHAGAALGEVPVSAVILGLAALRLRRRPREAALWAGAYVASLAIELAGKLIIERPNGSHSPLAGSITVGSFPSGHTMRVVVIAAAASAAWPSLRWPAVALAAFTAAWIELVGIHSLSEVFGGLLAALAIVAAVRLLARGDQRGR